MKLRVKNMAVLAATAVFGFTNLALAQSGTLDQESPFISAGFNLTSDGITWQQQARVGVAGQLEGVSLRLTGTNGVSTAEVSLGLGDAWSTNIVFSELVTLVNSGDWQFIDMTSANINLNVGDTFVIESVGTGTGMGITGSYAKPPAEPFYPEPLWLDGFSFADGGWRHAFKSYMLAGSSDCLQMTVSGLVAGKSAQWDVDGSVPHTKVAIVYGLQAGSTVVNGQGGFCCTFGIQGVNQSRVIGMKNADANGHVTIIKGSLPNNSAGLTVHMQAAMADTCPDAECVSNIDVQTIQ